MKKILLTVISVLILLFSSVLIYHVFSEDPIEIKQGDEVDITIDDILYEIDRNLNLEDYEVEIGEMI
jgi:hypothetical protein